MRHRRLYVFYKPILANTEFTVIYSGFMKREMVCPSCIIGRIKLHIIIFPVAHRADFK
jgi:hypothetical protein